MNEFDGGDEVFYINNDCKFIKGIYLQSDKLQPLEDDPQQVITFISIHDWSLR